MVSLLSSYSKKYDSNQYGKSDYWEDRYQRDMGVFDWYMRFASASRAEGVANGAGLRDIIAEYV